MESGGYPLALALEDFVPVALTGLGLWLVASWVGLRWRPAHAVARIAAVAVAIGGASKATWKLVQSLSDGAIDVVVLDRALFVFLAPGYLALLILVVAPSRRRAAALAPLAVWAVALALGWQRWESARLVMLAVAALASLALSAVLAVQASRIGLRAASILFAVHIPLVLGLTGLGRVADPSVRMQWIDQGINTVAQLCFLLAAGTLVRAAARSEAVAVP